MWLGYTSNRIGFFLKLGSKVSRDKSYTVVSVGKLQVLQNVV